MFEGRETVQRQVIWLGAPRVEWLGAVDQLPKVSGIENASPALLAEIVRVADRLGIDAECLAGIISVESKFNPQAVNPDTRATGLIQFMPSTARAYGTTVEQLYGMTALQQMPYVEKHFRAVGYVNNARCGDAYLAVFAPKYIGKPDSTPIFESGTTAYYQNRGLDVDGNGVITAGDVRAKLVNTVNAGRRRGYVSVGSSAVEEGSEPSVFTTVAVGVVLGVVAIVGYPYLKGFLT